MAAVVVMVTCGPRQAVRPVMTPAECVVVSPGVVGDTVTVVVGAGVDLAVAPWPQDDAERVVFHQLYETLVSVDCTGERRAGIAENWRRREGGRRWTFTLRRDARFWDGSAVTARDFVWSWQLAAFDVMTLNAIVDSVVATDDVTLDVFFNGKYDTVPRALAAPAFAVAKPSEHSAWLVGSAPYRVARDASRWVTIEPASGRDQPVLRFVTARSRDTRDLLQSSADVVITTDPTAIDYASAQRDLSVHPLPWHHTYVMLAPSRAQAVIRGDRPPLPSDAFTGALAGDAVRADARGVAGSRWWQDIDADCAGLDVAQRPHTPPAAVDVSADVASVVYAIDDATARDLAERVVALAATSPSHSLHATQLATAVPGIGASRLVATGVAREELARRLRDRDGFAFVISLPLEPYDTCHEARRLLALAPWLPRDADDLAHAVIGLVDTRAHAIVRRGRIGIVADVFGDILFVDALPAGTVVP